MQPHFQYDLLGEHLLLSADRCLFWEARKTLVLSDLHLGKSGHFRKAGIPVPQQVFREDLQRLFSLIQQFKPEHLLVIGDMFHSGGNREHEWFRRWRRDTSQLQIELVKGNHDILDKSWYESAGICLTEKKAVYGPFAFVHDKQENEEGKTSQFPVCGHLHPAVSLPGGSRQTLRLPCFYFGKNYAVLPAFGRFTGHHTIQPKRGEAIFAIVPGQHQSGIMQIQ